MFTNIGFCSQSFFGYIDSFTKTIARFYCAYFKFFNILKASSTCFKTRN
jgi:hypothetical protein